jgi:dTMP kinase
VILITFEGTDGSGKTTASKALVEYLKENGWDVAWSREPTYGKYGQEMRKLAQEGTLTPEKELELFIADRQDHVASFSHEIEVTDRYYHSTMAYQGARDMDMSEIQKMNEAVVPIPDLTLFIDVPVDIGLARSVKSGEDLETHFEQQDFLERVRENYQIIAGDLDYVYTIDSTQIMEEVNRDVIRRTDIFLREKFYDEEIAPKIKEIGDILHEKDMNMLTLVEYYPGEVGIFRLKHEDSGWSFDLAMMAERCQGNFDLFIYNVIEYAEKNFKDHPFGMGANSFWLELILKKQKEFRGENL